MIRNLLFAAAVAASPMLVSSEADAFGHHRRGYAARPVATGCYGSTAHYSSGYRQHANPGYYNSGYSSYRPNYGYSSGAGYNTGYGYNNYYGNGYGSGYRGGVGTGLSIGIGTGYGYGNRGIGIGPGFGVGRGLPFGIR